MNAFIDINLNKYSNVTTGKIYSEVLRKERRGEYLGATVQVIPHITDALKEKIKRAATTTDSDVIITEVGGTVGDIESLPFLEALRQMKADVGAENVMYIHTTLLPYLKAAGEMKTKPTQHSVKELRGLGIQPNMLVIRTEKPAGQGIKNKLAQFCDVAPEAVIESLDVEHLYQIPLNLQAQNMDQIVCDHLKLDVPAADMTEWSAMVDKVMNLKKQVKISLVGKYVELQDAYISVVEALKHSGYANDAEVKINWVNANDVTAENVAELLGDADGIIVPGGFGQRGTEGKIQAIKYAREQDVPMLGVCLGMQLTCIEFARHVLGLEGPIHPNWIQKPSIRLSISCGTKSMWKTWEERSVSVFTHLNSNEAQNEQLPMTIKKWYNVATVTVMSLTMLSVNSSKKQDLSSQAFHQTTVWSKSLKSQKTNSLSLANTTQNCQAVQTAQKDFTQPSSQRQLKTTIANKNQGGEAGRRTCSFL